MPNLKMIRVRSKFDELFENKIDLSDALNDEDRTHIPYHRYSPS